MLQQPKSLTAVIHVKFHYEDGECKPVSEGDMETIGRILEKVSGIEPELQDVLVKFADYLEKNNGEQSTK